MGCFLQFEALQLHMVLTLAQQAIVSHKSNRDIELESRDRDSVALLRQFHNTHLPFPFNHLLQFIFLISQTGAYLRCENGATAQQKPQSLQLKRFTMNEKTESTVTRDVTTDPFAAISYEIHISGRLTLLRTPRGTCGEWTCAEFLTTHPGWHRRLTSDAFLWLRDAVHRAIESGKLSSEFSDALQRLEWIRAVGIEYGAFTLDEVADHQHAPEWYSFSSGLPHWADEL